MELKHFRLIKTIAEEGSIANSSEKLFLTQSALSHQLRELENQLGFKVFFRTRNSWELSEQGQELYRLANSLFKEIDESFNQIESINIGSKGKIRVGTECFSFYQGLPEFLQRMAILYPDIEVDIQFDASLQPIPKILNHEIDIAIVTKKPTSDKISCIELYEDEIVCLLHQEHPLASRLYLEAGDFEDLHLLIHAFPVETVPVYEYFLKPNRVNPLKISAIAFLSVSIEMVEAGMGVLCMPKWLLSAYKKTNQLSAIRIGRNGLKRTQYLVFRKEDETKVYIRDFIANMKEEFIR